MFQTWITALVSWLPIVIVAAVVLIFIARRLWRQLPFFFLYLISVLVVGAIRYITFYWFSGTTYFYTFWICDLIGNVVVFLPVYEIFLRRLFRGFEKNRLYKSIFPLVAVVILILTVVTALQ